MDGTKTDSRELIPGVPVQIGTKTYVIAPLTFRQLKQLTPQLNSLPQGRPSAEQLEPVMDVIAAALSRNYPELTRDQLEDMIDISNMGAVVLAALNASGLKPRPNGVGEATAEVSPGASSTH